MASIAVPAGFGLVELLGALSEAPADDPQAMTVGELARRLGHCENWVRAKLVELQRDGKLECVTLHRPRLDGKLTSVPGYRLVG